MSSNDQHKSLSIDKFLKKSHFLKLTNDAAFKEYFKSNKEALKSLLTHFLPLPKDSEIIKVDVVDPDLPPDSPAVVKGEESGRRFVLDLKVHLKRNTQSGTEKTEIVNVEMQTASKRYFTDRILVYSCRLYSQQLKKGNDYDKLLPVYSLVFITKNLKEFKDVKDYYHVCNICRVKPPHVLMSKGLCFVIIELEKFDKNVKQLYDIRESWCYLLKNSYKMNDIEYKSLKNKGEDMAKATEHLWNLSQDEALQEYIDAIDKQERDRISAENLARREGKQEGIKKGQEQGVRKVALNMLKSGVDIQVILDATKLSRKELEQLKKYKKKENMAKMRDYD